MDLFVDLVHDYPHGPPLILKMYFYQRSKGILGTLNGWYFVNLYYQNLRLLFLYTCSNFSWIYMGLWVRFSQGGLDWKEKQYMKVTWGEVWRRYSLMQVFFWVSLSCMKINTKMDAWETRDEEVMHDDWVPSSDFPSLIALGSVYWLAKVLNPTHESSTK